MYDAFIGTRNGKERGAEAMKNYEIGSNNIVMWCCRMCISRAYNMARCFDAHCFAPVG